MCTSMHVTYSRLSWERIRSPLNLYFQSRQSWWWLKSESYAINPERCCTLCCGKTCVLWNGPSTKKKNKINKSKLGVWFVLCYTMWNFKGGCYDLDNKLALAEANFSSILLIALQVFNFYTVKDDYLLPRAETPTHRFHDLWKRSRVWVWSYIYMLS